MTCTSCKHTTIPLGGVFLVGIDAGKQSGVTKPCSLSNAVSRWREISEVCLIRERLSQDGYCSLILVKCCSSSDSALVLACCKCFSRSLYSCILCFKEFNNWR